MRGPGWSPRRRPYGASGTAPGRVPYAGRHPPEPGGENSPPRPWLTPPLLFEVGNSRLFQFPNDDERARSRNESADQTKCENGPLVFADIHPAAPPMFPKADFPTAFALAIGLSGLVVGAALSSVIFFGIEIEKRFTRRRSGSA